MKKIVFLLLIFTFTINVYADELPENSEDIKILYRWYKEEPSTDGIYYPAKDTLEGYLEDKTKTEYGKYDGLQLPQYCNYSEEHYKITRYTRYIYIMVQDSRYVKITNANNLKQEDIKIYYRNKLIDYNITKMNSNEIEIDFKRNYETTEIWFYIDYEGSYNITLSSNQNFLTETISKDITNEKLLIPDKTWITSKTQYPKVTTSRQMDSHDFIKSATQQLVCSIQEINTYRYKLNKVYYDDNYYEYIEGYLPDINDYIIVLPNKPVESLTKSEVVENNNKEYIYIKSSEQENTNDEITDSFEDKSSESGYIVNTKYIEKEVDKEIKKIPTWLYFILSLLIVIIILQFIIIIKKNVDQKF